MSKAKSGDPRAESAESAPRESEASAPSAAPGRSTGETGFVPRPVDPEEGRRRDLGAELRLPRAVVELTSPIGHRLRVPTVDAAAPKKSPKKSEPAS